MNDAYGSAAMLGGQNLQLQSQMRQLEAISPHAEAANRWKACAERLERARLSMEAAQKELTDAEQGEREAWNGLEVVSNRSAPMAASTLGPPRTR